MSTNETTWTEELLFNKERFEAWAFNQPDERSWDYTSNKSCAICEFLKETTSCQGVSAGGETVGVNNRTSIFTIPQWLRQVIYFGYANCPSGFYITGKSLKSAYLKQFPESAPVIEPVEVKGVTV